MLILSSSDPRGLGYIEIDHRSTDAPLPVGLARYFEADTYTCSHCHRVVIMNPNRKRERYKCNGCNHHICDECTALRVAGNPCKTMDQKFDEIRTEAERQALLI